MEAEGLAVSTLEELVDQMEIEISASDHEGGESGGEEKSKQDSEEEMELVSVLVSLLSCSTYVTSTLLDSGPNYSMFLVATSMPCPFVWKCQTLEQLVVQEPKQPHECVHKSTENT